MTIVTPLLAVTDLVKHFRTRSGFFSRVVQEPIRAVDGVSFTLGAGKSLGLVGESGSGKTTTGRAIMRLIEPTAGTIEVNGVDITHLSRSKMRQIRDQLQIVLQDPFASLDPRMRIEAILEEPLRYNTSLSSRDRQLKVADTLQRVGLNPDHSTRYPHEFSGGQRQRIGIARALILEPELLILDEPVSALDVSIQAQIINLLRDLQQDLGLSYLLIAHDLSVVRQICDEIAVMYLGKIVEHGTRDDVYGAPSHPYTQALLSAIPISNPRRRGTRQRIVLSGDIPSPSRRPVGCSFHTRCFKVQETCITSEPTLDVHFASGQMAACHFAERRSLTTADTAVESDRETL